MVQGGFYKSIIALDSGLAVITEVAPCLGVESDIVPRVITRLSENC